MKITYKVEADDILANVLRQNMSKKMYKSLKANKIIIYVNEKELKLYQPVKAGDIISFDYDVKRENYEWEIYPAKVDVIYEDENYLVVNKRRNLLTIPTEDNHKSLFQEVLYYLNSKGEYPVLSFMNRLDYQTAGLLLIAKNKPSANRLSPTHDHVRRKYNAVVEGILESDSGIIETYIDKCEDTIKRYVSNGTGKLAISHFQVLKRYEDKTLVEFELKTGRTHQIRVHCQYLGHPIIGDKLYNKDYEDSPDEENLYLCSNFLSFDNYGQMMEFKIDNWWENEQ